MQLNNWLVYVSSLEPNAPIPSWDDFRSWWDMMEYKPGRAFWARARQLIRCGICPHRDIEGSGCPSDDDIQVATIEFLSDRFKESDPWEYMAVKKVRVEGLKHPWFLLGFKHVNGELTSKRLGRFETPKDAVRYGRLISGHARTPIKLADLPYRVFYRGNQLMRGGV
jgi:hypothetical protein